MRECFQNFICRKYFMYVNTSLSLSLNTKQLHSPRYRKACPYVAATTMHQHGNGVFSCVQY